MKTATNISQSFSLEYYRFYLKQILLTLESRIETRASEEDFVEQKWSYGKKGFSYYAKKYINFMNHMSGNHVNYYIKNYRPKE